MAEQKNSMPPTVPADPATAPAATAISGPRTCEVR